jgi:hypothetical protein
MELFKSVCVSKLNVSESIVNEWCEKIENQYGDRKYHNLEMLARKMAVIGAEFPEDDESCSLVLASVFQYFHFDVKVDKVEENCEEFKRFVAAAGIDNVSGRFFFMKKITRMIHRCHLPIAFRQI